MSRSSNWPPGPSLEALPEDAKLRLEEAYVVPLSEDRVQVRGATQTTVMHGLVVREVFPHLLPLLDGDRTKGEIVASLGCRFDEKRITKVLDALARRRLLKPVEALPKELPADSTVRYGTIARYFGRTGSRYAALTRFRTSHVVLFGSGAVAYAAASSLIAFGFGRITWVGGGMLSAVDSQQSHRLAPTDAGRPAATVFEAKAPLDLLGVSFTAVDVEPANASDWRHLLEDVDFALAVVSGPALFSPTVQEFNKAALDADVAWTNVAIVGGETIHLGPAVLPGQTACYKCFELRFKSKLESLDAYGAFEDYINAINPPTKDFGCLPPVIEMAANMAALEVVRLADPDGTPTSGGQLITFDTRSFESAAHPVLKIPRCPACGSANERPSPRVWSQQ